MLERTAADLLDVLSDLSGPIVERGFETYLTGYPLPLSDYYALSRTWYASEMPRPGCVWTHTLLIKFSDLAYVRNLSVLRSLHRDPRNVVAHDVYNEPVNIFVESIDQIDLGLPDLNHMETAAAAIFALYEHPDTGVILTARSASEYEGLVLSLWSQQWPRLRRQFAFSTGSFDDRRSKRTRIFDFQVMPERHVARSTFRMPTIVIDSRNDSIRDEGDSALTIQQADWVSVALSDLPSGERSPLRKFFRDAGADVPNPRRAFKSLASLWSFTHHSKNVIVSQKNINTLLNEVAISFPSPRVARRLKEALLGSRPLNGVPIFTEPQKLLAIALAVGPTASAFDSDALQIQSRANALCSNNPVAAGTLFHTLSGEVFTDRPVAGILWEATVDCVDTDQITSVLGLYPDLGSQIIHRRSDLACNPDVWRIAPQHIGEFLTTLELDSSCDPRTVGELLQIARINNYPNLAQRFVSALGSQAISAYLDTATWSSSYPEAEWLTVLRSRADSVLDWLLTHVKPAHPGLLWCALVLDPRSPDMQRLGIEPWASLSETLMTLPQTPMVVVGMMFSYVVGIHDSSVRACGIAVRVYRSLKMAASSNDIGDDAWSMLTRHAPSNKPRKVLDRLRSSLVIGFLRNQWAPNMFVEAFASGREFREAVEDAMECKGGRVMLERVASVTESNPQFATKQQRKDLRAALKRREWWRL